MTPEQKAREEIDRQLEQVGWLVQSLSEMNIFAGLGVAVREFPLNSGYADYLLYLDGKAAGVIEAKREGFSLTGVETQTDKYAKGLPDGVPHHAVPLPFAYESTGVVTRFTNRLNPTPRSREVFTFHRPEEHKRLLDLGAEKQLRTRLQEMPELQHGKLWPVQIRAITNLDPCRATDPHRRPPQAGLARRL